MMEFAGTQPGVIEDLSSEWEIIFDGDSKMIQTIKVYDYDYAEDADLKFKYKYIININTLPDEEEKVLISLNLVLSPRYIRGILNQSIKNYTGGYLDYQDIMAHGGGDVCVDNMIIDKDKVDEYILFIPNIIPVVESFLGFHLDKRVNRLGSTGWDILKYALGLKKNWF